ncbi:MAG: class I SAM-dependent methyltransferase [Chloroflexi bacterium]|nr:class I SAM-dependent methyltransferase [Chloroflexota bacterium]
MSFESLLAVAIEARAGLFDARHETAFRLFNGFYEGEPDLALDLYARTLLFHNHAEPPERALPAISTAQQYLLDRFPWLQAIVVKTRNSPDEAARRGVVVYGDKPDRRVREHGVWYAVDLLLNRDASFYLDTRNLRRWAIDHLAGKTVLNTFAYTGSLGVAALAGGARHVVHLDLNRHFLNVAKTSYTVNGFPIDKADFVSADFFAWTSRMRRAGQQFDCVFVDPPFFSTTGRGTVDLVNEGHRVLNKVRPLIADGGTLVSINNALFLSGAEYLRALEALCADGYLSIEALIPVPEDFIGDPQTRSGQPPADPAPFNHSTKMAVLRVRRKDSGPQDPAGPAQTHT